MPIQPKEFQNRSKALFPFVRDIRRHLHRHPELSFQEHQTSDFLRNLLEEMGIPILGPFAGTGFMGIVEGTGPGPGGKTIALRADMDALPISEQTGLEFSSEQPGIMHACGHDIHSACLVGAARLLWEHRHEFRGTILLVFQPGEELLPGGARQMLDEGLFATHRPSAMIGQHVLPELEVGRIGFCPGPFMASSDEVYLTIKGKGGHGATPHQVIDPVLMAAHVLVGLQHLVSRNANPLTPTVLSFGRVIADGAVNVIPDVVRLGGTFRTMDEVWREKAHGLIRQVAQGIAEGFGGECLADIRKGYPVLVNDPDLTTWCGTEASELLTPDGVVLLDKRMTAEDFAFFAQEVPSCFFRLGVGRNTGETGRLHTGLFNPDEQALITGVSSLGWLALQLLQQG